MEKRTSGFEQIYKKPDETNVRAWIGKEETVQSEEAAKVKKSIVKSDYSSLYGKFKAKLDAMSNEEVEELIGHNSLLNQYFEERRKKIEDEFGVDCSKLQYPSEVLSFMASNAKQPNYYEPLNCGCVRVYTGTCNTHSVVIYVRGSHNIDEILKMPPFSFMEDLKIEDRDSFDIKEARSEWLDENYNVVAYFEPYESDIIGLDNKKGAICGECGDRFQVKLQTKEELLRLYYKSMG